MHQGRVLVGFAIVFVLKKKDYIQSLYLLVLEHLVTVPLHHLIVTHEYSGTLDSRKG